MYNIKLNSEKHSMTLRRVSNNIILNQTGRRGIPGLKGDPGDPATNLVKSVNGKIDDVVLNHTDVGADASGSASQALSDANEYTDVQIDTLATVASTGSYDDLSDKPTIPNISGKADITYVDSQDEALQTEIDTKVDKVTGKQLSTEDYTTAEKTKLSGIATGAQVNTVASVAGKTGTVTLTKSDVNLSNVDNTSDLNKPVSTATQTALNGKVNITGLARRLYGTNDSSAQVSFSYADLTADNWSIVGRNGSGQIVANTPTAGGHATTKAYVDTADALKVDKITGTDSADRLYMASSSGVQGFHYIYQNSAQANSIPRRTPSGAIFTATATDNGHSVPLSQLDARIRQGTGFPNGAVTAPVGSIYIDTNITNGASSWIKKSGTGNTGWQVLEGDTGWRNLAAFVNTTYFRTDLNVNIKIRRTGQTVEYLFACSPVAGTTGGERETLSDITQVNGFKPNSAMWERTPFVNVAGTAMVGYAKPGDNLKVNYSTTSEEIRYRGVWLTSEAWPTTLPGTAV